jgi:hypothetical protein
MYGGARYPAPAVVGGFGNAVAGSIERSAAAIDSLPRPRSGAGRPRAAAKPAAPKPSVEIYRGTTSNQYQVGG